MASETGVRELARTLVDRLLAADPFSGTALGLREYDALVPDASRAAEDALAADLADIGTRAGALVRAAAGGAGDGWAAARADIGPGAEALTAEDPADAVTLEVVRTVCTN